MPRARKTHRVSKKAKKQEARPPQTPDGRPFAPNRKDFDLVQLDELVQLQCTLKEIAAVMRVSEDTVERRVKEAYACTFAEYFRKHRGAGFVSLRRAQMKSALGGNVSMQQWLGRQWLGQTEHGSPVHPADEGEEAIKAAPPAWEVTIKNVPGGTTPQTLAQLMIQQFDPMKQAPPPEQDGSDDNAAG